MKAFLIVGIGGALGSMLRYGTSVMASKYTWGNFPVATFIANLAGCFLAGCLISYLMEAGNQNPWRLLLITGFCGGFTTFSAFATENIAFYQNEQYGMLAGYTAASIVLGFICVALGLLTGKFLL